MAPLNHEVGGLRCSDVLEALPDFLEGKLPHGERALVLVHLSRCRRCERFGGEYATLVSALRAELSIPDPAPEEAVRAAEERLRER